jgi:hypothetical protein
VLALLAGGGAWLWGESVFDYFKPSEAAASQRYAFAALNREMARTSGLNGALAFGGLGAFLGLALGLAGGLCRSSTKSALVGAIVGFVLGGLAGALPSFGLMPYQWKHRNDDPSGTQLLTPLLIHSGLWAGTGFAAGLAFGLATYGLKGTRIVEAALAGLVGAMLGTLVFELAGALAFPGARTANPFAETGQARLMARLCVALFVALGAIFALPRGNAVGKEPAPDHRGLE